MNFTFFSSAHRTLSRIEYILGHKSTLGKLKKIEVISSMFSDHNVVRLDVNYRKKNIKSTNIWKVNNTVLNNKQITEEIKKEIQLCKEMNENQKHNNLKPMRFGKSSVKGKVHNNTSLPQETGEKSNK